MSSVSSMAATSGSAARAEQGPGAGGNEQSGAAPLGTSGAVSGTSCVCVADGGSVSWLVTRGSCAARAGSNTRGTGAERHRGGGAGG